MSAESDWLLAQGFTEASFGALENVFDKAINNYLLFDRRALFETVSIPAITTAVEIWAGYTLESETVFNAPSQVATVESEIELASSDEIQLLSSASTTVSIDVESEQIVGLGSESEGFIFTPLESETALAPLTVGPSEVGLQIAASGTDAFRHPTSVGAVEQDISAHGETILPAFGSAGAVKVTASIVTANATLSGPTTDARVHPVINAVGVAEMGTPRNSVLINVALTVSGSLRIALGGVGRVRNPLYGEHGFLDLPVWTFAPDWKNPVIQSLEWKTDILQSQTGAEQRRRLRETPRRVVEFDCLLSGRERSLFDQYMITHGARNCYLPLWYDTYLLSDVAHQGTHFLPCDTAYISGVKAGDMIYIGSTPFDGDINQVEAVTPQGITTTSGLSRTWPTSSYVHPIKVGRFESPPSAHRLSDNTIELSSRFAIIDTNPHDIHESIGPMYRGFPVFNVEPESSDNQDYTYDYLIEKLDNETSIPIYLDTANLSFPQQSFAWVLSGRAEYNRLLDLMYSLEGRFKAVWLPTFFQDFTMVSDTPAGESYLLVENIGFFASGGRRDQRRDICIETMDGVTIYCRITNNTVDARGNEIIAVDTVFDDGLKASDVLRISFMTLSRLNQDSIEIAHHTDIEGLARVEASFRSAPDLRQEKEGF